MIDSRGWLIGVEDGQWTMEGPKEGSTRMDGGTDGGIDDGSVKDG